MNIAAIDFSKSRADELLFFHGIEVLTNQLLLFFLLTYMNPNAIVMQRSIERLHTIDNITSLTEFLFKTLRIAEAL